jgi:hypothetical protein
MGELIMDQHEDDKFLSAYKLKAQFRVVIASVLLGAFSGGSTIVILWLNGGKDIADAWYTQLLVLALLGVVALMGIQSIMADRSANAVMATLELFAKVTDLERQIANGAMNRDEARQLAGQDFAALRPKLRRVPALEGFGMELHNRIESL